MHVEDQRKGALGARQRLGDREDDAEADGGGNDGERRQIEGLEAWAHDHQYTEKA